MLKWPVQIREGVANMGFWWYGLNSPLGPCPSSACSQGELRCSMQESQVPHGSSPAVKSQKLHIFRSRGWTQCRQGSSWQGNPVLHWGHCPQGRLNPVAQSGQVQGFVPGAAAECPAAVDGTALAETPVGLAADCGETATGSAKFAWKLRFRELATDGRVGTAWKEPFRDAPPTEPEA